MNDTPDPAPASRVHLMATTPMRDWARGRLTGRLDYAGYVNAAPMPKPIRDLVITVVRKTRLWRMEKAEVARELTAHFLDGLDAGADAQRFVAVFGDPVAAARLIRRAKRRNRPLAWRAMIYARNGLAILLLALSVTYGILAARYFSSEPTISRDYLAELNAPARAVPENERAWPLYREAILATPIPPETIEKVAGMYGAIPADDPRKKAYADYLHACAPSFKLLEQAATRRHFGYILTHEEDMELATHFRRPAPGTPAEPAPLPPRKSPMLIEVLLPQLGYIRAFSRALAADSELAFEENDFPRITRNLRIQLAMAEHTRSNQFLISQLVSCALIVHASDTIGAHLRDHPEVFDDGQLLELAHRLSASAPGGLKLSLTGEIAMFEDMMQNLYTDDGYGDGHLTPVGTHLASSLLSGLMVPPGGEERFQRATGPVLMGVTVGRAEATRLYHSMMAQAAEYNSRPMWERQDPPLVASLEHYANDPVVRLRYWPVSVLVPALDRVQSAGDEATQHRDAALTAIALEFYRRRHGHYPDDLAALTPDLLPATPVDQFDGQPIKYRLRDGKPLLYSVGVDRKDDGGRAPKGNSAEASRWMTAEQAARRLKEGGQQSWIDGDWILYPPAYEQLETK